MNLNYDKFGRAWNLPKKELCPVCFQPDNTGDCNHKKLTKKQVIKLGGIILIPCPSCGSFRTEFSHKIPKEKGYKKTITVYECLNCNNIFTK